MSKKYLLFAPITFFLGGCFSNDAENIVVSQKFIHKYGFDVSEDEWENRDQEGQIVSMLKDGSKVTHSYENGLLHGPTIYTFPNSSVTEKLLVYNQGTLIKEVLHDKDGNPISEEAYEFDDRKMITIWDGKGAPISIEEYDGDLLVEGKYYTPEHELEGQVESGFGERFKRDRSGLVICRDLIENGMISRRTNFHPNGHPHSISHYHDYQLHGLQKKFTSSGQPLMDLNWDHGILDGLKVVYQNGVKVAEVPYINGQKHGLEYHFDDLGNKTAEIEWKNDKKHGCSRFFSDGTTEQEWFYKGSAVNQEKYKMLSDRDIFVAELTLEDNLPSQP